VRALSALGDMRFQTGGPRADAFIAYAKVLRDTYAERLQTMGETSDHRDPSTTTHLNVIDRHGNMVALTQNAAVGIWLQGWCCRRPACS